jgi:hypothetical protein
MPDLVEQIRETLMQIHRASLDRAQVLDCFALFNPQGLLNELLA